MLATPALAALLGAEAAARFTAESWPDRVFVAHTDRTQWPEFLRLSAWSDPQEIDRIHRGPVDVTRGNVGQYHVTGASISGWVGDLGLAARLADLDRTLPGAAAWLAGLEAELGVPPGSARLNGFVNPPGVGLGAHCDPLEHLLIHVAGEKAIRVVDNPAGRHVAASHALSFTPKSHECVQYPDGMPGWRSLADLGEPIHLRPGSVLLMPRGTYHETHGMGDTPSVSLVVQFELPSLADAALAYLREYLLQSPQWRTPAVRGAEGFASAGERLQGLLADLATRLPSLSATRMLETHRRPLVAAGIRGDDRFVRNRAIQVERDAEGALYLAANLGRGRVARQGLGPDPAELVVALAAIDRPVSFAEITERFDDWEADSLAEIVAFMVRKEIFVRLVPQPWLP